MKAAKLVIPLVVAGVVIVAAIARLAGRSEAEAFRLRREALRRELVSRAGVARGLAGPAGVEEARAVLRWWFEESAALRDRFPGPARSPDRPRAGKERDAEEVFRRYATERAEALRRGYAPVLSGVDQGLRLDLLGIAAGEHPETHERALRIDFALWGAPRRTDREAAGAGESARGPQRVVVPIAFRQLAFRFLDASGKTWGEMTGNGEPYLLLKDPERSSAELPPDVALGTWWVEPFPREAARVEIAVGVQVQGMTAGALAPTFRWELPVSEGWQLRPGEVFRAETREVPAATPPSSGATSASPAAPAGR